MYALINWLTYRTPLLLLLHYSSTVYVEGDCALNSYTDGEGKQRTALNIRQSEQPPPPLCNPNTPLTRGNSTENLQVLRKPQPTPSESES